MEKIWLKSYPKGIPAEVDFSRYQSISHVVDEAVRRFPNKPAFSNMDHVITFREMDEMADHFARYLIYELALKKGDRIALQMPNLLQYPVAMFGALKAGLVVVNMNPLYTEREMQHQLSDSGAKVIVILSNFAFRLEKILDRTSLEQVIVTEVGDLLPTPKRLLVNFVLRHIKKMIPNFRISGAVHFREALEKGKRRKTDPLPEDCTTNLTDLAFLQYTGGTTGVAKGAILTHKNIVANMMQISAWIAPILQEGEEKIVTALPLYHIFSLTVNALTFMRLGALNILVTNPRDIPAFVKILRKNDWTLMSAVNTLFNALMDNPDFSKLDFSKVKVSVAGGMALQTAVAARWKKVTGTLVIEGYGLTETSPVAAVNPVDGTDRSGTIGLPVPSTEIKLVNDSDEEVPLGETGEICVKGPQVMAGYWMRADETAKVMLPGGWLRTGDIGCMDTAGFVKIVDRKKDMILVSGFNVYPNEVEDCLATMPEIAEVAAVGVHDTHSGECVKVFVVRRDLNLTKEKITAFAKQNLAGYKVPKHIEFRTELPKTNVGKILRRALRDATPG